MRTPTRLLRGLARRIGFDVTRYSKGSLGRDPFHDMRHLLDGVKSPLILDVGANDGQTADRFKAAFPSASVHCFEPSPTTYAKLKEHCTGSRGVTTWNCGVGSHEETLPLFENSDATMSSFLAPGAFSWGRVERTTHAKVLTLDSFAHEHGIDFVHILKSDTQGYDLEVFQGAQGLMKNNRVALVYFESIFVRMYEGQPPFYEVFHHLVESGFSLVAFYKSHFFQQNLLSHTDVLFINNAFNQREHAPSAAPSTIPR